MQLSVFRITGLSPILQNSPRSMRPSGNDGLKGKKTYEPSEEAEVRTYRTADGSLFVPGAAFRAAMFKAAVGRKIGKLSAKSVVAAAVFPVEEQCVLLSQKDGKPISEYELHECRVVVNRAGVFRVRPKIDNWMLDLAIEIDEEMLPNPQVVCDLLNVAGKVAGIMDFRPERLGTFGRFTAELAT